METYMNGSSMEWRESGNARELRRHAAFAGSAWHSE
jgi:hypothetical protein